MEVGGEMTCAKCAKPVADDWVWRWKNMCDQQTSWERGWCEECVRGFYGASVVDCTYTRSNAWRRISENMQSHAMQRRWLTLRRRVFDWFQGDHDTGAEALLAHCDGYTRTEVRGALMAVMEHCDAHMPVQPTLLSAD